MKNIALYLFAFLFCLSMNSQKRTITGTVRDANDGTPLPGVNIIVKGTSVATLSDFDGYYTITAVSTDKLVYSYIGYVTQEIEVGAGLTINTSMDVDVQQLDEVVVVGYSVQVKRSMTYAVSNVATSKPSKAQLRKQKLNKYHKSLANQLNGKVPGLNVSRANNAILNIKGLDSPKGSQPLYIVDGTPINSMYNGIIEKIEKKDIDKVNVYKKGKAQALFGSIAKYGCIVISTKKGNYQVVNDEAYANILENKFESVPLNPLSTFSIDVDKASYSNVRRMINGGQNIPVDAVKIEEMVNYFDYDYPQPIKHPFSINTEVVQTPWNSETQLIRIGLQGKTYLNEDLPPSNLTFLIDVSGSMSSANKLPLLKSAFRILVNQLREKDKVSIVVYAGAAGVVLTPTRGNKKQEILRAIDNLEAGGSTAGGAGIELAYKLAQKNFIKKGNNRVILATDGDFNVGASSDNAMEKLIVEKRESGVFLSVLGFGTGNYMDSKMEKLADKGNGNHAYIDNMQEAQKVFGKEFGGTLFTIAKDVKIQVEFNPESVQAYRLIGYENRLLNEEDFIDDTKDAGELGSGHSVTAVYELVPYGVKSSFLKKIPDLKYTSKSDINEFDNELLTIKFRYKRPDGKVSQEIKKVVKSEIQNISSDFSFASAVALFGMHLRKSQFTNNSSFDDVLQLARVGLQNDKEGYRAEFIRLVKVYKNSI